jgi:hypothetical protein
VVAGRQQIVIEPASGFDLSGTNGLLPDLERIQHEHSTTLAEGVWESRWQD